MYHVELRQFPHNFCRFNLSERELRETILDAWLRDEWVELGERRWNPQQAKLTVLEGPQLPVEELSMGRGWRNAKRVSQEVSEQLLGAPAVEGARSKSYWRRMVGPSGEASIEHSISSPPDAPDARPDTSTEPDMRLASDSLGLEILTQLGSQPKPLAIVWRLARERYPQASASDCLKLAELAVRSLLATGLAVLLVATDAGKYEPCAEGEQLERALRAIDSWSSEEDSVAVRLRRA